MATQTRLQQLHEGAVMPSKFSTCLAATGLSLLSTLSGAAVLTGGSDLLTSAGANQLQAWLGQGNIELKNIFDMGADDHAGTFHQAADAQGDTFSVIRVRWWDGTESTIGGYNPRDWTSNWNYNVDGIRNAFVFNLTTGTHFGQRTDDQGRYQTFNGLSYGPTFGGGHDIWVDGGLNTGYSQLWSYGELSNGWHSLKDPTSGIYAHFDVLALEVFTVDAVADVPEPGTYGLVALALIPLVWQRRASRRKAPDAT